MMSEHCVRHCTLMMVCGIVLGKAKTTKVGMVWYELNIVNQRMTEWISMVGIELVGQLKVWISVWGEGFDWIVRMKKWVGSLRSFIIIIIIYKHHQPEGSLSPILSWLSSVRHHEHHCHHPKNLKIQKFREQRKDTGILDKTTNEGTLAENDLKLALPYLTRLLNGESSHQSNKWGWALFIFGGANYKQGVH